VRCFVCLCVAAICSLFRCKNYEKNCVDFLGVRIEFFVVPTYSRVNKMCSRELVLAHKVTITSLVVIAKKFPNRHFKHLGNTNGTLCSKTRFVVVPVEAYNNKGHYD